MQRLSVPNAVMLPDVVKLLNEGMTATIKVKGNSMLPFIVGDKDSVMLIKSNVLDVGHIVLARLGEEHYVLHRVIEVDRDNVTLMGDGNLQGAEHCKRQDICGRVVKIIHNDKDIIVDKMSEMRKAKLWRDLKPIRRYLLAIYRRLYAKRIAVNKQEAKQ